MYSKIASWRWIACLFETCIGCYQNKIQEKVHLFGFIIQFITIHGQYNIKFIKNPSKGTHHLHNLPLRASGRHRHTELWRNAFTFLFRHRNSEDSIGAFAVVVKVKVKQFLFRPVRSLRVAGGSGSQITWQSVQEGGKVVSPTFRQPLHLLPWNIPVTHFY